MGGDAGVSSEPGVGSTFWFNARLQRGRGAMPPAAVLAATPPQALPAAEALRQHHAGAHLLLAEDNPINREVALDLLHDLGLVVDTAADGMQAVQMARARAYDLVLMDMRMPLMDGLQATQAIRQLPGWQGTPILAMTANAFAEDRQAALAAGMNDFIAKPVDVALLHSTLLRWLSAGPAGPAARAAQAATAAGVAGVAGVAVAAGLAGAAAAGQGAVRAAAPHMHLLAGAALRHALAQLATVPGLDVTRGVAMLLGKSDRYVSLLGVLVDVHADDMARLVASMDAGDEATARRIVHTIKGTAGTLAAWHMAELAARLEAVLRNQPPGAPRRHAMQADMDAFNQAMLSLAAALPMPA
jgi:CheY-like chemotaxis protein